MSRIVFSTDFSPSAASARVATTVLARALGATVEVAHVFELPASLEGGELEAARLVRAAEADLERERALVTKAGVSATAHLVPGEGAKAIVAHLRAMPPALAVLGTHGRTGAGRVLLGSVAEAVVHAAPCPVLVVREAPAGSLLRFDPATTPLRLVVGLDLSAASDAAVEAVRFLRTHVPCDVTFLHLFWPPRERARLGLREEDPPKQVALAVERELRRRLPALPGRGHVSLHLREFPDGDADPFAWEGELEHADLLILGTHQHRHSTALAALRASPIPVLCAPARP